MNNSRSLLLVCPDCHVLLKRPVCLRAAVRSPLKVPSKISASTLFFSSVERVQTHVQRSWKSGVISTNVELRSAAALSTSGSIRKKSESKKWTRSWFEVSLPRFTLYCYSPIPKYLTVVLNNRELERFVVEYAESRKSHRIEIKEFRQSHILEIVEKFAAHDWSKPAKLFEEYLLEQNAGERVVYVAYLDNQFAGYITLKWDSQYKPFHDHQIPEIMDLNVLPPFRRLGVGLKLLTTAESKAASRSDIVGIGVGLYGGDDGGYGSAQKLYVKCGYIPDGRGVTYNYQPVVPGAHVHCDDDLVLWFTKQVKDLMSVMT